MAFSLPDLPYGYDALVPHYSEELLSIHHQKHHQAYTNKLNTAIEGTSLSNESIENILSNLASIDQDKRIAIVNNGGGYYNHSFFWDSLTPAGSGEPKGDLLKAIIDTFDSLETFKKIFENKAINHFGSGWAWLVIDANNQLQVTDTHDQICPLSLKHKPLLTIDVWEHAYYLQYKNVRPEWVVAFWNIVDWEKVEQRYAIAKM